MEKRIVMYLALQSFFSQKEYLMIPYQNYNTNIESVTAQLQKDGVAVIPNVLNAQEITATQQGMWEMLEHVTQKWKTPIQKNNPSSWRGIYELFPLHSMLIQNFGLSHSQYVWNIRQNEKIAAIFAQIWNCKKEELLTSFDGLSIHFPPETTGRGWYRDNGWLHVDQSYTRNGFECVQGFISAWDIEDQDASFTFLEKSHHYHKDFKDVFDVKNKSDWYKLNAEEMEYYRTKNCIQKAVRCAAGSLVLWDSRLVHAGIEPQKGRKNPKLRHVIYVCQTPKNQCPTNIIKKRIKAFEEQRTTNHWPHKTKLFPKIPRTYGNELPELVDIEEPKLTELGKKLVGYEKTLFS